MEMWKRARPQLPEPKRSLGRLFPSILTHHPQISRILLFNLGQVKGSLMRFAVKLKTVEVEGVQGIGVDIVAVLALELTLLVSFGLPLGVVVVHELLHEVGHLTRRFALALGEGHRVIAVVVGHVPVLPISFSFAKWCMSVGAVSSQVVSTAVEASTMGGRLTRLAKPSILSDRLTCPLGLRP